MVAVVAAMGGEIEGDRQALLAGGEIAPVEGVGVLRGGEPRILAQRPGLRHVHGGIGAAQIGRDARVSVEEIEPGEVVGSVDLLYRDAFGGEPRLAGCIGGHDRAGRVRECDGAEIGNLGHGMLDHKQNRHPHYRLRCTKGHPPLGGDLPYVSANPGGMNGGRGRQSILRQRDGGR